MIHDKARVEAIRARAVSQIELIKSLEARIVKGKHAMLEVARNQTGDIETFFLQDLTGMREHRLRKQDGFPTRNTCSRHGGRT